MLAGFRIVKINIFYRLSVLDLENNLLGDKIVI